MKSKDPWDEKKDEVQTKDSENIVNEKFPILRPDTSIQVQEVFKFQIGMTKIETMHTNS